METLYDDLIGGVISHFYRLSVQDPKNKNAVWISGISTSYGAKHVLSARKISYDGKNFIQEEEEGFIPFTDLRAMQRVSDKEEKEIKSKLEILSR